MYDSDSDEDDEEMTELRKTASRSVQGQGHDFNRLCRSTKSTLLKSLKISLVRFEYLYSVFDHFSSRIREKRKLVMMESREKRKVEKPRLPRTAKKMVASQMEKTMEDLGVEFEDKSGVRVFVELKMPLVLSQVL